MPRSARGKTEYAFLDSYAELIERLLPTVRAVGFFDFRGDPLRGRGPVPLLQTSQVRAVLKSAIHSEGHAPEALVPLSARECAAVLVLTAGSGARPDPQRSPPVTGVCLMVIHVPDGAPPPSLQSLHVELDPALACIGHHLAAHAPSGGRGLAEEETTHLEWLFEVTTPAVHAEGAPVSPDRGERLAQMMAASVAHLQCILGALLVPERHLRIVRTAGGSRHAVEEALGRLEPPVLTWVRRKNRPMVINQSMRWSAGRGDGKPSSPLRLLAVPISGHASAPAGALLLLRSENAPAFTRGQLALVRHLGRHVSTLLETDFDVLTGLHTRSSAQGQIDSWVPATSLSSDIHSVIVLDIDRLRSINETSGFDAGDALILRVARLLAEPLLPAGAVVARIAGDEFAIALPQVDTNSAAEIARALQQAAGGEMAADEPVSLSCGIASFAGANEFEGALALAQIACRTAKDHGRGRVELYLENDDSMIRRKSDLLIVHRLREALRKDRFMLFAQRIMPLQGVEDGAGFELLLRSPQTFEENRAPADLLAAAHRNQLAPTLDMWVIEHALAEAAPYRSALLSAHVSLSINITGPSLTDAAFLERVKQLIHASRIGPSLITFEITETIAVLSLTKARTFIRELRAMGCRFALDDFGTGTNSLKNLTTLPVDRVKIDGSFVKDILSNRQSVAMIRAIVSLTRDLGIGTVAEYAENARIIEELRTLGVEYAQGYGVETPRALKDVLDELRARESAKHAALGREI
jgi:diguanylate cyclase (GGDEF)-like protein